MFIFSHMPCIVTLFFPFVLDITWFQIDKIFSNTSLQLWTTNLRVWNQFQWITKINSLLCPDIQPFWLQLLICPPCFWPNSIVVKHLQVLKVSQWLFFLPQKTFFSVVKYKSGSSLPTSLLSIKLVYEISSSLPESATGKVSHKQGSQGHPAALGKGTFVHRPEEQTRTLHHSRMPHPVASNTFHWSEPKSVSKLHLAHWITEQERHRLLPQLSWAPITALWGWLIHKCSRQCGICQVWCCPLTCTCRYACTIGEQHRSAFDQIASERKTTWSL